MMDRLTHYVTHHRRIVIGAWIALTLLGVFASAKVADRWLEDFSIPGYSAYEANQRTVGALGNGEIEPFVAVLRSEGDVTKVPGVEQAIDRAVAATPGARVSSYFTSGDDAYVSSDRHVTFAEIYPAGKATFEGVPDDPTRQALAAAAPTGVTTNLTGIPSDPPRGRHGDGPIGAHHAPVVHPGALARARRDAGSRRVPRPSAPTGAPIDTSPRRSGRSAPENDSGVGVVVRVAPRRPMTLRGA